MVIDAFTVFGSWPGQPDEHPVEQVVSGIERYKLDRACSISTNSIFLDSTGGNIETLAATSQDPRLAPIGAADPRMGGEAHVEYCCAQGMKLLALFPIAQHWAFDTILARALLHRIAQTKLTLMVEVGGAGHPTQVLRALEDITLPVVLLDVSLYTLAEVVSVLRARPNTYLATRLLCGGDTVEYLVDAVGADRLIFASRFPVSCFSSAFLTAKFATLSESDRALVMGDNMAKLLA